MNQKSKQYQEVVGTSVSSTPPSQGPMVVDWIATHALRRPEARAQIDLASGRVFTYREMNVRVGCVAGHLASLNVQPGARVGYLAMNSTDIHEIIFGAWRIGASGLALNYRLTVSELTYIINDAAADVIVYDSAFQDTVEALQETTEVRHWIKTDGLGGDTPYEQTLRDAEPLLARTVDQPLSEQCLLMYSSGTTGQPKGVIITHEMMLYAAMNFASECELDTKSVNFAVMPLFHVGGLNCFSCPTLYFGGTTVVQRMFEPGQVLGVFNDPDIGVTHFLGVPAIYNALKEHPNNASTDFSRVKVMFAGAESVPDSLVHWWYQRGCSIREGYGMTESVASSCSLPQADVTTHVGSAGKPLMHCR